MGSCGCSGGMKNGRVCGCGNCRKKYNRIKFKPNHTLRSRKISGDIFTLLPHALSGTSGHGPYAAKGILQRRAQKLRQEGHNARVIDLAKGSTLWISSKVRYSQKELDLANDRLGKNSKEFRNMLSLHTGTGGAPYVPSKSQRRGAFALAAQNRRYNKHEPAPCDCTTTDMSGRCVDCGSESKFSEEAQEYFEINYNGDEPTVFDPKRTLSSGKKAQTKHWEMLESFWPAYWMGNRRYTDGKLSRVYFNSFEADIAGGYGPDDPTFAEHLPSTPSLNAYMTSMPDEFETFLMPELDNHTVDGGMITTQFARLGSDSPAASYISKKVVVGDTGTWLTAKELGPQAKYYNGKRKYNHLQWWSPGNLKIVDKNENAIDDRVE